MGTRLIERLQRQGFPRLEAVTQDASMKAREERMEAVQLNILRGEIEGAAEACPSQWQYKVSTDAILFTSVVSGRTRIGKWEPTMIIRLRCKGLENLTR